MKINNTVKLIISIGVSLLAGVIGSLFTVSSLPTWYEGLVKPVLNPPSWVFGPVWTILYVLMGISLWLVWKSGSNVSEKKRAIALFLAQLILNAIWSPIFFGARSLGNALVVIVLLWAAVVLTILIFTKISRLAAWLLVPYILWVSFAVYLNFSIWQLNKNDQQEQVFCTQETKLCTDGSYVGRTGPNCEFTPCP